MIKRVFAYGLILVFALSNFASVHAIENNQQQDPKPYGFSVYTYPNNWQGNEIIVFMEVDLDSVAVTITNDMYAMSGHNWSDQEIDHMNEVGFADQLDQWIELGVEEPEDFEGDRTLAPGVVDILLEGEESLTIEPGETKVIARIQAGNPMSWRNFYQTVMPTRMILNLNIDYDGADQAERVVANQIVTQSYAEDIKIYDPETKELWNIYDDDLVFFAGDKFHLDFTGFPTGWSEKVGPTFDPSGTGYPTARMYFMVSYDGGPPTYGVGDAKILEEAQQDDQGRWYIDFEDVNGTISVIGTVADDLPEVSLGYEIYLFPSEQLKEQFADDPAFKEIIQVGPRPIIYEEGAIADSWDFRLVFFGIGVPELERVSVYPDLSELGNLFETEEELNLTNPTTAIVTFDKGLNIMGIFRHGEEERYFTQLAQLDEYISAVADSESHTLSIKVDTSVLTMFAGHPATIQFLKAAEKLGLPKDLLTNDNLLEYLEVSVLDQGVIVDDLTGYIDLDLMTYDENQDTLTVSVKHFTEYIIGLTTAGYEAIESEQEDPPQQIVDTSDTSLASFAWVLLMLGFGFLLAGNVKKRRNNV